MHPPPRHATHGAKQLARRLGTTRLEGHLAANHPHLVDHECIDLADAGEAIESALRKLQIGQGVAPGKREIQMVEVEGIEASIDRTLDVVRHAFGDRRAFGRGADRRQHEAGTEYRSLFHRRLTGRRLRPTDAADRNSIADRDAP